MPLKNTQQKKAAAASKTAAEESALRKTLKRKRGEIISYKESRVLLTHYYSMRRDERLDLAESLKLTAKRLGFGLDTVTRAVSSFEENGAIVVNSGTRRGGCNQNKLDKDIEVRLAKKMQELNGAGGSATTVELQKWLKSEPDEKDEFDKSRVPVDVTAQTVGRWFKRLGYEYLEGAWRLHGQGGT